MFKYILIILFLGCSTTKNIQKDSSVKTESVNLDSLVKVKTDSVRTIYEEALKELTTGVDFVLNNNDSICQEVERQLQGDVFNNKEKADSLLMALRRVIVPVNKVIVRPTGETEYIGQIKSANFKLTETFKRFDSLRVQKEISDSIHRSKEDSLRTELTKISKKTKVKSFGWLWFLVGFLGATFIWKRNQIISYLRK